MMKPIVPGVIIAMVLVSIIAVPVSASMEGPDTTPSLEDMSVYRHLITEDDFLAVVPYNIPYADTPDVGVDKAFIFRLLGTDNTTELGAVLAYPYFENGYGRGVVSFYFDADDAPTWGLQYTIAIAESPAVFEDPESWVFTLNTSDYSSFDTHEDNQSLLKDHIIDIANELTVYWSIDLLEPTDTGTALSSYGESYFRSAVRGLQSMCPDLFYVVVTNVDMSKRSWDYSFAHLLANTFADTWVWSTMTGFGGLWGIETNAAMGFFVVLVVIVLFVWSSSKLQSINPSYLFASAGLIWGSLNGWFSLTLHALIAFMFVLVGSIVLFLNRS